MMAVIAVANGVFRETVLIDRVGEYTGHVLSTAMLVVAIIVVAALYFGTTPIDYTQAELLAVGASWTVLTVGFEFLVGFLEGTPPSETIAQYNVLAGQVWIVVPLTLLFAPLGVSWLSGQL
ncbi:hypothetical protein [Halorhabdus tiamatea]|uniref:hypothetical protein n=1 Tax=Halorhabdus tiamatea TaxID=430914 RepID=UPI00373FCD28